MGERLRNCPFCGNEAATVVNSTFGCVRFKVYCPNCNVEQSASAEIDVNFEEAEKIKQKVIESWNKRVPDTNNEKINNRRSKKWLK